MRVGFIVNPIAGMGGRLGLGGTDGEAYLKALEMGAKPWSPSRATEFLRTLRSLRVEAEFITCRGGMGSDYLKKFGYRYVVIHNPPPRTTAEDTIKSAREMAEAQAKIIVFVGGDGTARDVLTAVDKKIPILGVPAGVKMFSSVFAVSPRAAAHLLKAFLDGRAGLRESEVMDIDEELYRSGVLSVRLYGYALTPHYTDYLQGSKSPSIGDQDEKVGIAKYFKENIYSPEDAYVFGPGTTVKTIMKVLGLPTKNPLGVDLAYKGRVEGNLSADRLAELVGDLLIRGVKVVMVVSPIGGQGFLFGRGNMQISPKVIRMIGKDGLVVVASKSKVRRLRYLYVDTGDEELDRELTGYLRVVTGYNEETIIRVIHK